MQLQLEAVDTDVETPPAKKNKRSFQKKWLERWPWLSYDEENDLMFCKVCKKVRKWLPSLL